MTPAITLTDVQVCFGEITALSDVSVTVPEGAFLAIVGPNGAGKTVLVKLLLGLIEPSAGEVRVLGSRPAATQPLDIGYVPQVKTLKPHFPAKAIELVATGLTGRWPWQLSAEERTLSLAALERIGAAHLAERSIQALSGGERQRVYLARSLARRPRLLLLDEPATGIDYLGEADLYHILEHYQAETGATICIVTHDWSVAEHHASLVLFLNQRVIALGPPGEALSEEHLRTAFGHHGHTHEMRAGGGTPHA